MSHWQTLKTGWWNHQLLISIGSFLAGLGVGIATVFLFQAPLWWCLFGFAVALAGLQIMGRAIWLKEQQIAKWMEDRRL